MNLQAENEKLRQQLEEYRQRELADLREQLAEAKRAVEHYRAEAQRNADLGRQIAAESQGEIARLKERISVLEETRNVRVASRRA